MTASPSADLNEALPASPADRAEYERQLAWVRDAIDEGWEDLQQGRTSSLDDVLARLEERKRQRDAALTPA